MKLQYDDFVENDAWLIFRLDIQVASQSVDVYLGMDLPSGLVFGHELAPEKFGEKQAQDLLQLGKSKKGRFPRRILLVKGDPAESVLEALSTKLNSKFEAVPAPHLEDILGPIKESFGKNFFAPSTLGYAHMEESADELDRESAKHMVPDSYDPCSCASGKKFKFCCKPVFRELLGAMMEVERGRPSEAIQWIAKAKTIGGETAEILCREAIVLSVTDPVKSDAVLAKSLEINPNHPRANYIKGITLKDRGDYSGAIAAYETAITNYPKTDRYHLNEAYNNLGTAYFETGKMKEAKAAWEQALVLLPSDRTVRENLIEFIYQNPALPGVLREISPFVQAFLTRPTGSN